MFTLQYFIIQIFPETLLESTYIDEGSVLVRSEVERRAQYFQYLQAHVNIPNGRKHPVVSLMIRCLDNYLSQRPKAQQLVTALKEIRADIEGPHGDIVKMDAIRHVVTMRKFHQMDAEFKVRYVINFSVFIEVYQSCTEL